MARRRKPTQQCLNCGTDLHAGDHFCPHCGQENHDLRVPFRHFAYEFIESFTHFDTKLWSTLKLIFTKPGQLTKDFVEGKRARYVKPAQFYVFVSIIFFSLLSHDLDRGVDEANGAFEVELDQGPHAPLEELLPDSVLQVLDADSSLRGLTVPITAPFYAREIDRLARDTDRQLAAELEAVHVDTSAGTLARFRALVAALPRTDHVAAPYSTLVNGRTMRFQNEAEELEFRAKLQRFTDAQVDSLLQATTGHAPNWLEKRIFRAQGQVDLKSKSGRKQFLHAVMKASSIAMFVLMPFTAMLLLWIFYRKRFYWEHLIFSIHIHTIYFLFFSIVLLFGFLFPRAASGLPDGVFGWLLIICFIYLALSLRRVYGKSWAGTIGRLLVMAVPYLMALVLMLASGAIFGFFSL